MLRVNSLGFRYYCLQMMVGNKMRYKHSSSYRTQREGLSAALEERPRPGAKRKLDAKGETYLITLACSEAPEGRENWTVQLLAEQFDAMPLRLLENIYPELPARPDKPHIPRRQDYSYEPYGLHNALVFFEPLAGFRHITISNRKTKAEFAQQIKYLNELYPDAETIH
ncbi:MAG: hypothetical protein AAF708_00620 [Deinococcota bacterium]